MVKAGATWPPQDLRLTTVTGEINHAAYLVANYLPDDFDPSAVTEAMIEEIYALNREMIAAGARSSLAEFPRQQRKDGAEAA